MKIGIASDHAGHTLRAAVRTWLEQRGHEVHDRGPEAGESVDYPDYGRPLAIAVSRGEFERGILICGTGQGMAMTANAVVGVRAAVVSDPFSAGMAMAHNDARVLCMGERVVGQGLALLCVEAWLDAEFEGGRHQRRVLKIEAT